MSNREALLVVAVPLICLKIWATILVLMYQPTREALLTVFGVFGWPWLVVIGFLVLGPGLAWWRLVRVRAKRAKLKQAEWMGQEPASTTQEATSDQWPLWETVSRLERDGS
jgi:hypothetical protein